MTFPRPTLDHVERMLAETYRRELEQEENMWRSLPFFAAALALQLTALFQAFQHLPRPGSGLFWAALCMTALSGAGSLVALVFLARSIFPNRYEYIATEASILAYSAELDVRQGSQPADGDFGALVGLKDWLSDQYVFAIARNRTLNLRRSRRRSVAGLAILVSIAFTLVLVAIVGASYILGPAVGTK